MRNKRKQRSSPAKQQSCELSGGADQPSPSTSPVHKMSRPESEDTALHETMEGLLKSLSAGQEEIKDSIKGVATKVDEVKTELSGKIEGLQQQVTGVVTALAELKADVDAKTGQLKARVDDLEQQVATQKQLLADLTAANKSARYLHLSARIPDSKCNGKPEEYLREMLQHMQYNGVVLDVVIGFYTTGPTNSKIWIIDFRVQSTTAANMIRKKANDYVEKGSIQSLGLYKTKPERAAESIVRKSAAFKQARDAAKARNQPVRWGFGTCTVAGEEWTPAKVAAMEGQA